MERGKEKRTEAGGEESEGGVERAQAGVGNCNWSPCSSMEGVRELEQSQKFYFFFFFRECVLSFRLRMVTLVLKCHLT